MKYLAVTALCSLIAACATQKPLSEQAITDREDRTITSFDGLPLTTELTDKTAVTASDSENYDEINDWAQNTELNTAKPQEVVVKFDTNSSKVAQSQFKALSEYINTLKNKQLQITGYTDTTGSTTYNKALSMKRATSVKNWLLNNGFSSQQVKTTGAGELNISEFSEARVVKIKVLN